MVCINRHLIGVRSKLYGHDDTGPLSSQTVDDHAQYEYFEYDSRDIGVELLSTQRRHYDATEGVWLNEDPVGFEGGQVSLYCYPSNGPV